MKKPRSKPAAAEIRPEYDYSGGVRGKYVDRYRAATNVVLLKPETTLFGRFFPSQSVRGANVRERSENAGVVLRLGDFSLMWIG